jgi:imidazole glycerol phosphate synthase glutamine amidotransferase subunit
VTIAILDYGVGNLPSVARAVAAVGGAARIVREPADVDAASDTSAIIVPGVGHFQVAADRIHAAWRGAIRAHLDRGRAVLGICLGMQWLFEGSDEAPGATGLGVLPGRSIRLPPNVKVPHVGWNTLDRTDQPSRLLEDIAPDTAVYFTHTYAVPAGPATVATSTHGVAFAAAVEAGPLFGTQFHPEKSGAAGLRLLANFLRAAGAR